MYSAFSLLFTFFGVAGLYVLLQADFLAVTQILIYVGGILVRQHGVGIGRHVVYRIAQLSFEAVERQLRLGDEMLQKQCNHSGSSVRA